MKIIQDTHLYLKETRMVWYLKNEKDEFVDLFDYNINNDTIRFYGTVKEIDPRNVNDKKLKQWHINNFNDLIRKEIYVK